jgi:type III secretion system YscD/HrpQ family protein
MTGYLICEDGPLSQWTFTFDEGDSWIIGRDGDLCSFVLEDPMVSRKHVRIFLENNKFYIENESSTNPALLNDLPVESPSEIKEDDLVQIGNNIFRFTTKPPASKEKLEETPVENESLTLGKFPLEKDTSCKWMLKVILGPSSGAQFPLHAKNSYVIGSDTDSTDVVIHDLSISKNHARITLTESSQAAIIDLKSRNGVFVNGKKIDSDCILKAQDIITIGTTSILFIDIEHTRETIYSPGLPTFMPSEKPLYAEESEQEKEQESVKNWKDTFIPAKHLAAVCLFCVFLCVGVISLIALFKSSSVVVTVVNEKAEIKEAIAHFEDVVFDYNPNTATLFLSGHVLTDVDYSELIYRLKNIPYINSIDDNVVIDEAVYENMNALLIKNPVWASILMTARKPGEYILTGYIKSESDKIALTDYINNNFNYLNLLSNQVVVEDTLNLQIASMLESLNFTNVVFEQNNGRVVLSGRANQNQKQQLDALLEELNKVHGIRVLKNFVLFTQNITSAIDITDKYTVTGSSKYGGKNQFVLINGKILGVDDKLDGMNITTIESRQVLLEKDGIKYKIDFNE